MSNITTKITNQESTHNDHDPDLDTSLIDTNQAHMSRSISSSGSSSNSRKQRINEIIHRIHDEKIPYIGIYKPGELGGETWRAVVPSPRRRGKGRGLRGGWESIVLSTPTRGEIVKLLDKMRDEDGPVGVRHIVNPHCNQDEGMRIVWPSTKGGGEEMRDWSRRDRMMRDGKTVQALVPIGENIGFAPMPMLMPMPIVMGFPEVPIWDNIGWTRLC